jgi:UDP-N-acetylglucosamine 2-epimerase
MEVPKRKRKRYHVIEIRDKLEKNFTYQYSLDFLKFNSIMFHSQMCIKSSGCKICCICIFLLPLSKITSLCDTPLFRKPSYKID